MLEVGPGWLEPTKFDLTFTNVKTQKCVINNTEVGLSLSLLNIFVLLYHRCSKLFQEMLAIQNSLYQR